MTLLYQAVQNSPIELVFCSGKGYKDAFSDIEFDCIFTCREVQWRVPGYWAGENEWRIRFAPPEAGEYAFVTKCSDSENKDLHGCEGKIRTSEYAGENPLFKHGPLRISCDRTRLEHSDGRPFFWLGDTWWMALTKRLHWPDEFQRLTADRLGKGFTVIQLVGGLFPDMPPFDPRGANETGLSWEKDWKRMRPEFFDTADLKIQWLVRCGLVPCIFGCWSYYLPWLGIENMKRHWRYLVARWGAYPVVWSLAGEAALPYPLSETPEQNRQKQIEGWAEVGRYLREIDSFKRPVTIHPSHVGRDEIADETALDFNMLQTGHGGYGSIANNMEKISAEVRRLPRMPVVVGETSYEGMLQGTKDEIQRLSFWGSFLSGASGFTYGADGIWQFNRSDDLFGPSPQGSTWGNTLWEDAVKFPGAVHLGLAKKFLETLPWHLIEPHQEWVTPAARPGDYYGPYAGGIPGRLRLIYLFYPIYPGVEIRAVQLEKDIQYHASWWDPRSGKEYSIGEVKPDADRSWRLPLQPELKDWLLVMRSASKVCKEGGKEND